MVLRLGQRQAREAGPRLRRVGSYPIPRRPHYSLCPAPGREARGRARGASIVAHGMTTPFRTNVDAPASALMFSPRLTDCERRKNFCRLRSAAAEGARRSRLFWQGVPNAETGFAPHERRRLSLELRRFTASSFEDSRLSEAKASVSQERANLPPAPPACGAARNGRRGLAPETRKVPSAPSRRRTMPEVSPHSSRRPGGARSICRRACGPRLPFQAKSLS
jgi:hypothetical protein